MSTLEADADRQDSLALMTKGVPDVLLARCSRERVGVGDEPLTDGRRAQIVTVIDRMADDAEDCLGSAYRPPAVDVDRRP